MAKTKRREKFFLWAENYEKFKALANSQGISASALLQKTIQEFQPPGDAPKKARNLTIDYASSELLQEIADQWFRGSSHIPGNRSEAVNYIIMKAIQDE